VDPIAELPVAHTVATKKERKDNIKTQQEIVPKNRTWQWKIWWKIRHLVPKPPCIGYRMVPHATYVKMYTSTYTYTYPLSIFSWRFIPVRKA
jgi:hypothetical protein